jgi:hypothetical protein
MPFCQLTRIGFDREKYHIRRIIRQIIHAGGGFGNGHPKSFDSFDNDSRPPGWFGELGQHIA